VDWLLVFSCAAHNLLRLPRPIEQRSAARLQPQCAGRLNGLRDALRRPPNTALSLFQTAFPTDFRSTYTQMPLNTCHSGEFQQVLTWRPHENSQALSLDSRSDELSSLARLYCGFQFAAGLYGQSVHRRSATRIGYGG